MANRKNAYWLTADGLLLVRAMARDGAVDADIAGRCGISARTLYRWKKRYPAFAEALQKGKELVDVTVENALLANALGYEYTEQQPYKVKRVFYDPEGRRCEEERVETVEVRRRKLGETTAQILWLKNRRSDRWRDKAADPAAGMQEDDPLTVSIRSEAGEEPERAAAALTLLSC